MTVLLYYRPCGSFRENAPSPEEEGTPDLFERQFSLGIPEVLGTLAGQDIDKFIERVTVIIWLLAGGMLSHMKFVGLSCRDKRLTVCVERLERFFIEARRYYFIRLFKLFGYHLPYSSFR